MMPLFKLGMLFMRTLSKPIAAAIKKRAMTHPSFKNSCAAFAQWYHRMEINMQVQLMGITARAIKPLDEATAVKTGAEILGEGVVFSIAALAMLAENRRSAASEARKQQKIKDEFEQQEQRLAELESAFAILRQDTIEIMSTGGKWTKEQIAKRVLAEKERKEDLKVLTSEEPQKTWQDSVQWWLGLGQKVANGEVEVADAAVHVGKSAFVAITPSYIASYVMGTSEGSKRKRRSSDA
mmetsp:Transcript_7519/g.18806  ORF Transcript_7519/g.18806 Transcript_7519/m.18806 type:complete len:238 (+) Transcript_7519:128-841(+)